MRDLVNLLYRDAKLCVIQHGIFSEFFNISRGCRQGDPLSPYLFLLCVEILGIMIRKETNIKGIKIGNTEYKLFQYADDTGIILDGTEQSLRNVIHLLDQYAKYSGLTPNLDKTVMKSFVQKRIYAGQTDCLQCSVYNLAQTYMTYLG
jgi:hypothetical protein